MVINPMSCAVNRPLVFDVNVLIVDPVAVEKNKFCATKLRATYISLLTFTICVEILITVDAFIYNVLMALLIVDTAIVLVRMESPVMVINPMSCAVNRPLVFDVNVLIVDPVAVEKNKFCATKLRDTYMSWLTFTIGVEILIELRAFTYNVAVVLIVHALSVLAVITFPTILSVDKPPVVAVMVVIVWPLAFVK